MRPEDYDLIIPCMRIKKERRRGLYRVEYVGAPGIRPIVVYTEIGQLLAKAAALTNFVKEELKKEGL